VHGVDVAIAMPPSPQVSDRDFGRFGANATPIDGAQTLGSVQFCTELFSLEEQVY